MQTALFVWYYGVGNRSVWIHCSPKAMGPMSKDFWRDFYEDWDNDQRAFFAALFTGEQPTVRQVFAFLLMIFVGLNLFILWVALDYYLQHGG